MVTVLFSWNAFIFKLESIRSNNINAASPGPISSAAVFFSMSHNVKFLSLGKRCVTSQKTAAEETSVGHDDLQFSCAAFG